MPYKTALFKDKIRKLTFLQGETTSFISFCFRTPLSAAAQIQYRAHV